MKKNTLITIVAAMALFFSFESAEKGIWLVDKDHAKLGFTVNHLMVSDVDGWFKTFDAKVTSSGEDFSDAVAEMTADVSSVNTESEKRDKHLMSEDFFDAAKYPLITFKSTSFKKVKDNTYKVIGDLTMHGVTKTMELDAVSKLGINPMNKKAITGFKITGKINRSDFGIAPSTSSAMVGDDVTLVANAEFVRN